MPDDNAPTTVCQAEECTESPEFVCDAYVMTPPLRGFLSSEVFLCAGHTKKFEAMKRISVVLYPDNPDLVSAARWRD